MTEKQRWSKNSGASEHVTRLLEESGAMLETQVAEVCEAFVQAAEEDSGLHLTSDSVTYGLDTQDSPLREIDQNVGLYKEFVLDERTGVTLKVEIPIEAKYRRDVEVFGIDFPARSYKPRIPMQGFVLGTSLSPAIEKLNPFENLPLLKPVLLEIESGSTPKKVEKENLIYNAASALYDFVHFEFGQEEAENTNTEGQDAPSPETQIILDMNLLQRFDAYLLEKHYAWWSVIFQWMDENLTAKLVNEFNNRQELGSVYHGLEAFCPILFVNGPIWHHKGSKKFVEQRAFLTRVRVNGWPGRLRQRLVRYTVEAPLVITNANGLRAVLDDALRWFVSIEKALKASEKTAKKRWLIESAFYNAAVEYFILNQPSPGLRSDIDYFEIMQRR